MELLQLIGLVAVFVVAPVGAAYRWGLLQRKAAAEARRQLNAYMEHLQDLEQGRAYDESRIRALSATVALRNQELLEARAAAGQLIVGIPESVPAGFEAILRELAELFPNDPLGFFMGWRDVRGVAYGQGGSFHGDSPYKKNQILLTAAPDHGKDGWLACAILPVLVRAHPREVQLCWIEGKGPDGNLLRGLQHNWLEPVEDADVGLAMEALRLERQRRMRLLKDAEVVKWEELPAQLRPPLLIVVVSEIAMLEAALSRKGKDGEDLDAWLKEELSGARAGGIRYILCTQNASNMGTGWRDLCAKIGGYQISERLNLQNLDITAAEVRKLGGVPVNELTLPGAFTIVDKGVARTVRTSKISTEERKRLLAPLKGGPEISAQDRLAALKGEKRVPAPAEHTERAVAPVIRLEERRAGGSRVNLSALDLPRMFPRLTGEQRERLPHLVQRWEEQIREWGGNNVSRNEMARRIRAEHSIEQAVALALFRIILGEARGPEEQPAEAEEVLA